MTKMQYGVKPGILKYAATDKNSAGGRPLRVYATYSSFSGHGILIQGFNYKNRVVDTSWTFEAKNRSFLNTSCQRQRLFQRELERQ